MRGCDAGRKLIGVYIQLLHVEGVPFCLVLSEFQGC